MDTRLRGTELVGRRPEPEALNRLLAAVRAGESRALVLRGEAGIGKSALLGHLVRAADDCRVVRADGVESELELAYAGLQQLCRPLLHLLNRLPRAAARGAGHGVRAQRRQRPGLGDQDRNIPVAALRSMSERAGSRRTVEIPGASHVVGISHAGETAEVILEAARARRPRSDRSRGPAARARARAAGVWPPAPRSEPPDRRPTGSHPLA